MEKHAGRKRTGYLIKRGKVFHAVWTVDGKKFMQSTKKTVRREAEAELNQIMAPFTFADETATLENLAAKIQGRKAEVARLQQLANPPLRIEDAWDAYERGRPEVSSGTLRNYDCYWKAFKSWLAEAHPKIKTLRDVSFEVCTDYRAQLIKREATGRTINAHRAFLRAFWNVVQDQAQLETEYTLKDGRVTRNPWAKLPKRDEHSRGRRPLTVEELRLVCRSAKGELRVMLAFGLYLGARMGDAACMDWGSLDMVRRRVLYTPRKTERKSPDRLVVPMHPELYAILDETPAESRTGPVCPEMAARYERRGADGVSDLVQRHFEDCGLTTTGARKGGGIRRVVEVGFHSLRHTAVTLLREAGAAQSISQAIVGHNSIEVHNQYTKHDELALRRAVDQLPALLGDDASPGLPAGGKRALTAAGDDGEPGRLAGLFEAVLAGLEGMTPDSLDLDRAKVSELVRQAQALAGAA